MISISRGWQRCGRIHRSYQLLIMETPRSSPVMILHTNSTDMNKRGSNKGPPNIRKNFEDVKNQIVSAYDKYVPVSVRKVIKRIQLGTTAEINNAKIYWRLNPHRGVNLLQSATYHEMMAVNNFRRDGIKSVVVLIVAVIPMGFWLIWLPILIFPRQLFPRGFWTPNQKRQFYLENHMERIESHKVIVHHFNYHKGNTGPVRLEPRTRDLISSLGKVLLDRGVLKNQELLAFRSSCKKPPFSLDGSNYLLLRSFCKVFEVNSFGPVNLLTGRLGNKAAALMDMDTKLQGMNLNSLTPEEVMDANYIRGLNTTDLSHNANLYWLKNWLALRAQCTKDDTWFILHAMVFHSLHFNELKYQRGVFS